MWSNEWKEKEEKTHVAPIDVELIFLLDEAMSKREREKQKQEYWIWFDACKRR